MALKRKRSSSELSPFSSSNNSYSSRDPSSSPTPFQRTQTSFCDVEILSNGTGHSLHQIDNWTMTINPITEITPQHLDSRTRKRFRDSRPDEQTIHDNTYQKLYLAQRSPTPQAVPAHPRTTSSSSTTSQKRPSAQSSLHNFWALPDRSNASRRVSTVSYALPPQRRCEDCDTSLGFGEDDNGMDIEMGGMGCGNEEVEYACRECSRRVCDMCAVVVVGEGRECLGCKTSRKRWVGGIGWMQSVYEGR